MLGRCAAVAAVRALAAAFAWAGELSAAWGDETARWRRASAMAPFAALMEPMRARVGMSSLGGDGGEVRLLVRKAAVAAELHIIVGGEDCLC